jgi:hypothetical protein
MPISIFRGEAGCHVAIPCKERVIDLHRGLPLEALFCAQPASAGDLRIGGQWQPLSARARWWRHQDEIGNPRRNSKTMHCDAHTRAYERTAPVESIESFAIE